MDKFIGLLVLIFQFPLIIHVESADDVLQYHLFESKGIKISRTCFVGDQDLDYIQCTRICIRNGDSCQGIFSDGQICRTAICRTEDDTSPHSTNIFVEGTANEPVCSNKYFLTSERVYTIEEAIAQCTNIKAGSKPAEPADLCANQQIVDLVAASAHCTASVDKNGFYLGLRNPSGTAVTFSDGTPIPYSTTGLWHEDQPDNENQIYMSMNCRNNKAAWGDRQSNVNFYTLYTVCEY